MLHASVVASLKVLLLVDRRDPGWWSRRPPQHPLSYPGRSPYMAQLYSTAARKAASLVPSTSVGEGGADSGKVDAEVDGTRSSASNMVRDERYRLVGQKTWNDQRAHVVDATVGEPRKRQILTRTGVFEEPFGLHKPPNLFQVQPTFHAQLDTYHSYLIAFSLRDILGLLKSFVFVDKAIERGARKPSQRDVLQHYLSTLANEEDEYEPRFIILVLRSLLFTDGPDHSYITLLSAPDEQNTRHPQHYYSQITGDLIDDSGLPYPPFLHHCTRNLTDAVHLLALVLNAINKIWWFEEMMLYKQGADRETFDAYAGFSEEAQLIVAGIKALAWRIFNPPTSSVGLASPSDPPSPSTSLLKRIESFLKKPTPTVSRLPATAPAPATPSRPGRPPGPPPPPRPAGPDNGEDQDTPRPASGSSSRGSGPVPRQPTFPRTTRSTTSRSNIPAPGLRVAKISLFTCAGLQAFDINDNEYSATGFISIPGGTPLDDELRNEPAFTRLAQTVMHCVEAETALSQSLERSADSETESTQAALRVLNRLLRPLDAFEDHAVVAGLVDDGYVASGDDSLILTYTLQIKEDLLAVSAVDESTSSIAALFVKGAPESVLERCGFIETGSSRQPLTPQLRDEIKKAVLSYGSQDLRTLAFAYDNVDPNADHYRPSSSSQYIASERTMTFVGLVGMLDSETSSIPALRSICIDVHRESVHKVPKQPVTALLVREHARLIAEWELTDHDLPYLIDLAFRRDIAWEYRKVLLRRLFFTGEQPLFDDPAPFPPDPAASQSDTARADSATEPPSSRSKAAPSRSPLGPTTGVGLVFPNRPATRPSRDDDADKENVAPRSDHRQARQSAPLQPSGWTRMLR